MISAIVLAAGQSTRMGQPKLILPWKETTVIGQVVKTLINSGLDEIIVVTGGAQHQVKSNLQEFPVRFVSNLRFESTEMTYSLKIGMTTLRKDTEAIMVTLGDQPQIEISVVEDIIKLYRQTRSYLVIPSYKRRRGHPWLIDYHLFPKITELNEDETLRDFLDQHQDEIRYLQVNEESVLQDLDTLADYQKFQKNLKMD